MGRANVTVSDRVMAVLQRYKWPGNIRELKNVIERAVSLSEGQVIDVDLLPPDFSGCPGQGVPAVRSGRGSLREQLARCEKEIIGRAFLENRENMRQTSKELGISRSTLYDKAHKHNLI